MTPAPTTDSPPLSGRAIIDGLHATGIEFVVSVPDVCTSSGLLQPISSEPGLRLVRVCKEDEGVSICAALSFCDRRAILLMQQTGLMDSLNALRAVGVDYQNPVCMVIGLLGHEGGTDLRQSRSFGVRVIPEVLEAMGIRYCVLNVDADILAAMEAIAQAYSLSAPIAILLGRNPA